MITFTQLSSVMFPRQSDELDGSWSFSSESEPMLLTAQETNPSRGGPEDLCFKSHMNGDNIKIKRASSSQDSLRNYSFCREKGSGIISLFFYWPYYSKEFEGIMYWIFVGCLCSFSLHPFLTPLSIS